MMDTLTDDEIKPDAAFTLNPHFQAAMPGMIERGARAHRLIEEALAPLAEDLRALTGYLDFEIEKVQLAIEKAEWSSRAQLGPLLRRRAYLSDLSNRFQASQLDEIGNNLEEYLSAMQALRGS